MLPKSNIGPWTLRSGSDSSRGLLHIWPDCLLLHVQVLSWELTVLSHDPAAELARSERHHGSESGHPFLDVRICGVHLLLPLFPLELIVLQLVFVLISLELLVPEDKGAIPLLE